jgi:hypothetical protein
MSEQDDDLLFYDTDGWNRLAHGTAGQCLKYDGGLTWGECGTGGASAFSDLNDVNLTSSSTGDVYYNNGGEIVNLGIGTDGQVLTSNGTVPGWEDASSTGGGVFHYEEATSTDSQTVFNLSTFTYDVGDNELEVFVNGVYQIIGDSYEETDSDTITFNSGLNAGDRVVFAVRGGATAGEGSLTQEEVEDYAGAMATGNTETLITVTYQDADGTIDYVVDNDLSNYDNSTSGFFNAEGDLTTLLDDNYDTLGQATSTLNGHTTTYNHNNYDTAYSWGDHADAGYNPQSFASSSYVWASDWTTIDNYPSDCSAGNVVTGLGDTLTCTADDDVPESGDFGNAGDLDADGTLSTDSIQASEIDTINCGSYCTWDTTNDEIDVTDNWWDADGDISADEISESKINFSTACGSGNHYYLSGNDLACEADDDTPDNDTEVPDDITIDTTTKQATTSRMTITDGTNGIRITPGTDGSTSTISAF